MLDTIQIQLCKKYFDQGKMLQIFNNKLIIERQTEYKQGYQGTSLAATCKNFKFYLTNNNFKAVGSLTKLSAGNNLTNLSHEAIRASMDRLQDILDIPLCEAKIKRLDIGCNIPVKEPVREYLRLLIRPASFIDFKVGDETVDFRNMLNSLNVIFYNKVAEAFKKGKVPALYKDQHVLRYELRLKNSMIAEAGFPDLCFGDLYDQTVYKRLINSWYDYYLAVPKIVDPQPEMIAFDSVKGFKNSLAIYAINQMGGSDYIESQLQSAHTRAKPRFDIRKVIKSLKVIQGLSPMFKEELDAKIYNIYQLNG